MVNKVSMKQYLIDELRRDDHKKLKAYLDDNLLPSSFDCTYWLKLDKKILTPLQKKHETCYPHVFAIVLEEKHMTCEFLVRIKKKMKCDCMAYATYEQQNWLIKKIDTILEKLNIQI